MFVKYFWNIALIFLTFMFLAGCNSESENSSISSSDNNSEIVSNYYHLISRENDYGGNGSIESVTTFTSDNNGNLIRLESYGEIGELLSVAQFTYNSNRNLIKKEWDSAPANGIIDSVTTYTYDVNGKLTGEDISITQFSYQSTSTYQNIYDINKNLIRIEVDDGNNSSIDNIIFYAYDNNGKLIKQESDWSNNGSIDSIYLYTYNNSGKLTRKDYVSNDSNETYLYIYNSNGKLFQEGDDQNGDGLIDRSNKISYIYNSNGQITKIDKNQETATYTYDINGNVIQEMDYYGNITNYIWQQGQGYSKFYLTNDTCLLVSRLNSPEETLFDSVFK